ncbi:hypothetical protein 16Q_039 [Pseudomonas phage 16Q]|nr:hypothetical protein 16Q_039 [Pseudomonas phage 16Q]
MSIRKERKVTGNGLADWSTITNKPSSFPPMQHPHPMNDVDGLMDWVDSIEASMPEKLSQLVDDIGFMRVSDGVDYSSIKNTPNQFSGKYQDIIGAPVLAPVASSGSYNDLTNRPAIPTLPSLSTVALSGLYSDLVGNPVISYPVTSVNSKTGALALSSSDVGAAPLVHTHSISNITGLQAALDGKANSSSAKRQETFSGLTDSSGNYTVVFSTPFSTAPNIQVQLVNAVHNASARVSSVSANGFTISAGLRASLVVLNLNVLGIEVTPTANLSIDVLVTSK